MSNVLNFDRYFWRRSAARLNQVVLLWLVLGLLLSGCQAPAAPPPVATDTATSAPSETPLPSETPQPSATPTATLPPTATLSPTLTPTTGPTHTFTPTPTTLPQVRLGEALASEAFAQLGLAPELSAQWQAFAAQPGAGDSTDLAQVQAFLRQWEQGLALLDLPRVPEDAPVALRVAPGDAFAGLMLVNPDTGVPYLIARDAHNNPAGLVAPEPMNGMVIEPGPDGWVHYVDAETGVVLLRADARQLDEVVFETDKTKRRDKNRIFSSDEVLSLRLAEIYRKNHAYTKAGLFPRYYFPIDGIETAYYTVERSLTIQALRHMHEAFDLFTRPELLPLKQMMFFKGTSVIVMEEIGYALGLTYTGTQVMELNRKDLFGNRYDVAEVLAHEGAHVMQGRLRTGGDVCDEILRHEVGDQKVPSDLSTWTAAQLANAIKSRRIGAYHVSLWVLYQVNPTNAQMAWLKSVIATGKSNGMEIINCDED